MMTNANSNSEVYIVDGLRTPFLKARGIGVFSAADLAVAACKPLLLRQNFTADAIDEIVTGCTMASPNEANISRIIALRLGCGNQVPAYTVQRNCGSGLQAIDNAVEDIRSGRNHLVLAGGTEAMSHAPLLYRKDMVQWFASIAMAKGWLNKLWQQVKLSPKLLMPVIALKEGLTDPIVGLDMGQTAEKLAYRFHISRQMMDAFALRSHERLIKAQEKNHLPEVTTIFDTKGKYYTQDDGVRRDTTLAKLATLKPTFDKKFGAVTAGNSSQVTDGAAFLILASASAVKKYHLPVKAKIVASEWAALDPSVMGLGPVLASTKLLQRLNLNREDIDYWEINEAFAAQVLACLQAWQSESFCQEYLGLNRAFGAIDEDRLNIHGGAICMGHPIGASGARLVLGLISILEQQQAKRGIASLCIGGGQGGAMLLERVTSEQIGQ
ncbi:MAG: acetyl-CoA C-acetyltransferase [Pseudomonadota bacterium]